MPQLRLRTVLVIVALFVVLLTAIKQFSDWSFRLKSEYAAAGMIAEVTEFVESHEGRWPSDWSNVPGGAYASKYVNMRFDITADELVANPRAIYDAITPKSGEYRTYPHAEAQLDKLRQSVIRHHSSLPVNVDSK